MRVICKHFFTPLLANHSTCWALVSVYFEISKHEEAFSSTCDGLQNTHATILWLLYMSIFASWHLQLTAELLQIECKIHFICLKQAMRRQPSRRSCWRRSNVKRVRRSSRNCTRPRLSTVHVLSCVSGHSLPLLCSKGLRCRPRTWRHCLVTSRTSWLCLRNSLTSSRQMLSDYRLTSRLLVSVYWVLGILVSSKISLNNPLWQSTCLN